MAADLHIHVMVDDVTEEEVRDFLNPWGDCSDHLYKQVAKCPDVWVGEVSWLKAALTGDEDEFVPEPVRMISSLFHGGIVVITDDLIAEAEKALKSKNQCDHYKVDSGSKVLEFLKAHKGKSAFTVSW